MAKKKISHYTRQFRVARREWSRSNPERRQCYHNAKRRINGYVQWNCASCRGWFFKKEIQCDHRTPVRSATPQTFEELVSCLERLLSPLENLQILCKPCHQIKTNVETALRKHLIVVKEVNDTLRNKMGFTVKLDEMDKKSLKNLKSLLNKFVVGDKEKERKIQIFLQKYEFND